jgi:L-arabinose isomerase
VPRPDLKTGAAAWIHAGGAHHTAFSQAIGAEHIEDFCAIAGVECIRIGSETNIRDIKNELRWNEIYYMLARGL